jgi:hypothetical protein
MNLNIGDIVYWNTPSLIEGDGMKSGRVISINREKELMHIVVRCDGGGFYRIRPEEANVNGYGDMSVF